MDKRNMGGLVDIKSQEFQLALKKIRLNLHQADILKQTTNGKLVGASAQLGWFFIRSNLSYVNAYEELRGKSKTTTDEDVKNQFGVSKVLGPSVMIVDDDFTISSPSAVFARAGKFKQMSVERFCAWAQPEMKRLTGTFPNSEYQVEPLIVVINPTVKIERILSAVKKVLKKEEFKEHKLSRRFSLVGKELSVDALIGAIICHHGKLQKLDHKEIEYIFKSLLYKKQLTHNQSKTRATQFFKLAAIAPWFLFSPTRKN